jgi:hypothetical protein
MVLVLGVETIHWFGDNPRPRDIIYSKNSFLLYGELTISVLCHSLLKSLENLTL